MSHDNKLFELDEFIKIIDRSIDDYGKETVDPYELLELAQIIRKILGDNN